MKNACIIGFGAIGPVHAEALSKTENVRLWGICDIKKERADEGAEKYGCRAVYDFSEVLKNPEIDSVHICTPHYLHHSMAIAAVEAGKAVVLEKPCAFDYASWKELFDKARDKKVCVMFQTRMNNAICEFKRLTEEDKTLGKLLGGFASQTWYRGEEYYNQDPWRGKWETEGGGVLINQAIHLIDLVSFVAGDIKSVRGSISNKSLKGIIEVEDTADAVFTLADDVKICFYASNACSTWNPARLELKFENAVLRYCDGMLFKIEKDNAEVIARNSDGYHGKKEWGISHDVVIDHFYNGGEYCTLADAENTMETLFKFYESAKNDEKEMLI